MALSLEEVRGVAHLLTRPHRFYTHRADALGFSHVADEEVVWEIYQGRLLDVAHSREHRSFESWNIHALPDGDPGVPLLSLKLDAGESRLFVVRGVESYVWEGFSAEGNVVESREKRKWIRELIATLDLTAFMDPEEFRQELASALTRAVTGVRLALNPIETPLPAFSFGELFYLDAPAREGETLAEPESGSPSPASRLLERLSSFPGEPSRLIEAWLRATSAEDLPGGASALAARWSSSGWTGDDLLRAFRRLFNEVSLSPWTDFADRFLRLLALLQENGTLHSTQVVDCEGFLLRQLGRHLSAYDLVTFHFRGANYPDALLLDAVLADYLARLEREPALFAGEAGRLRRRALRQAWVVRRRYEGHPTPDAPTSPGEQARVFPAAYPRVPEPQIVQIGQRRRRLFDSYPLLAHLSPTVREVLRESLADLAHCDERQELGAAVFLDRPFGLGKTLVEPDATLLLASLAYSRVLAGQRLRSLASDLAFADADRIAEELALPGLPLDAIGPAVRPGTLSLADAARSGPDFVFRFTLPGSVSALRAMLGELPCEGAGALDALTSRVLLARSLHGPGLVVYDESFRPLLELEARLEQGFASRRGLEFPRAGFRVKRVL